MFNRRESARLISRVVIESMVTNKFPKSLNIKNKEEKEEDKEKSVGHKPINRSLSQGNYPINRVNNKQTLAPGSVGPNKSTSLQNSSNSKKSQRIPDRRPRSVCGSPDLQAELKAQSDKSDNNTIPIRRNKEKLQARPRSKTQSQTEQQPPTLTNSQKSAESSSIVIIKKRPTNNPPVTTPEAPQSNAELLSTINFHYNSPDLLNIPFPLSIHHPSNPPQTNQFIFDNLNPFNNNSTNSLSKSQPPVMASINPFLTPEVFVPNNIPNTQIPSYHNNNPFLQN